MNYADLETLLNIKFKNAKLLEQAMTHRSYLNENQAKNLVSNERLEFLGDAVLSLIVSNFLYHKFSQAPEGDLTNYRASLVKTQTLAKVAVGLKIGQYLLLSHGEEEGGGRDNHGILADCLEAIIGAIFIDRGLQACNQFITNKILPLLPEIIETRSFKDYKSLLQEKMQAIKKISPEYKVIKTSGPDHRRLFTIAVFADKEELGAGSGYSKQIAEQAAAKSVLENSKLIK